jgi:AbrB family looped-hinge helix DNA binding protein
MSKKAPSLAGKVPSGRPAKAGRLTDAAAPQSGPSGAVTFRQLTVPKDGRVVIPADLRDALGLKDGGTVVAEVRDGALVLETMVTRLRRIRDLVRASDRGTGSVVDEFLAEKRAEAARE